MSTLLKRNQSTTDCPDLQADERDEDFSEAVVHSSPRRASPTPVDKEPAQAISPVSSESIPIREHTGREKQVDPEMELETSNHVAGNGSLPTDAITRCHRREDVLQAALQSLHGVQWTYCRRIKILLCKKPLWIYWWIQRQYLHL